MLRRVMMGLALVGLAACGKGVAYAPHAGSVAMSMDGTRVYAVDTDNNAVEVADSMTGERIAQVGVGKSPARITVGPDDRIYITNRGERSVSVVKGQSLTELTRIPVGVEPVGLSLSADAKELYVVSATDLDDPTQGTLTEIDTASLAPVWSVKVGEEPRGVAVVGQKAYVSNLKKGQVAVVDLETHQLINSIDLSDGPDSDPSNPAAVSPGAATDVAPTPDGNRVIVTHNWQLIGSIVARNGTSSGDLPAPPSSDSSYGGGQTPTVCGSTSIVTPGVATIDTGSDQPKAESLQCSTTDKNGKDFPSLVIRSDSQVMAQGAVTSLVDPSGSFLYVVNQSSSNVIVMPMARQPASASTPDPSPGPAPGPEGEIAIPVGLGAAPQDSSQIPSGGPDGIALSKDGKTAYVYNQFDHLLSIIRQDPVAGAPALASQTSLAADVLPADQVAGRKLFFSSIDSRMTSPGVGIACASCHLEGREDGHVWQFPDGPRQTPSLAGRKLSETAPYHWAGIFPSLNDFYTETITNRMGGTGLSLGEAAKLTAFVESIPPAENPLQNRPDLAAAQAQGRVAFTAAGCAQCHTGDAMTDNGLHDVGTITPTDLLEVVVDGVAQPGQFEPLTAVNTPSLLGLGRTAPYLHDGSVLTIRDRIDQSRTEKHHGDTSQLSDQEISDLESYLKSL